MRCTLSAAPSTRHSPAKTTQGGGQQPAQGRPAPHGEQAQAGQPELPPYLPHLGEDEGGDHHPHGEGQLHRAAVPGRALEVVAGHQGVEGGQGGIEEHAQGLGGHQPAQGPVPAEHRQARLELRPEAAGWVRLADQGRDLHPRQGQAGQGRPHHVAEEDHRQGEGRVQGRPDHRPQEEGPAVEQLHPAVGPDQLVRRHQLGEDGLNGRLLEGAAHPPQAQQDQHGPGGQGKLAQQDGIPQGRPAHGKVRGDAQDLPVPPVRRHPRQGAEQGHGQVGHQPRRPQHPGGGSLLRQPPDEGKLHPVAAQL